MRLFHKNKYRYPVFMPFCSVVLLALLITGCKGEPESKPKGAAVEPQASVPAVAADEGKLHFDAGISSLYEKQYDQAIEEFEKSLKFNPHSPSTLNNIGFAFFDKGDMDKAIEYQKRVLAEDSEFANGYFGLALALESKGDQEGAVRSWKEFLSRTEPGSKWAQKARQHIEKLEKADKPEKPDEEKRPAKGQE